MKIVTFTNPDHGACTTVHYDNGSRAPVAFFASTAAKAESQAQDWYDGEQARFAKLKQPTAKKVAAPVPCDACDMLGEPCRLHA